MQKKDTIWKSTNTPPTYSQILDKKKQSTVNEEKKFCKREREKNDNK